jgi:hypothetical protein
MTSPSSPPPGIVDPELLGRIASYSDRYDLGEALARRATWLAVVRFSLFSFGAFLLSRASWRASWGRR